MSKIKIKDCSTKRIVSYLRKVDRDEPYAQNIIEALDLGWDPDIEDAINRYHTVCAELDIGEGYAEHLIEDHGYREVLDALAPCFGDQADDFLADHERLTRELT